MERSSVIALRDAFRKLYFMGDNSLYDRPLKNASWAAANISAIFRNVNSELSGAWQTIEDFTDKIDTRITNTIGNFTYALTNFCDQTYSNEAEAKQAADTANTQAEAILKDLGL